MNEIRYETPEAAFGSFNGPFIFLAGPTVRGHQQHLQPSWRFEAVELFKKIGFDGTLIIPEFNDLSESDKDRPDIPLWEFAGLKLADCILFWIPRTRELIGLTTNFELGYWMKEREKVVYGRPDDAYRIRYLDIMWKADLESGTPMIYNTLESTVQASAEMVQ